MASRDVTVTSSNPIRRSLVFISHASPEDNDFARWLGAQLACSGYEVWCDVIKLSGGELFWDDIEHAIGEQAAKFVVALSQASANKAGVLDEIAFAINTERGRKLRNFVIPIRLDDLNFSRLRANVTRKNVIDFKESWATGLAQLSEAAEARKHVSSLLRQSWDATLRQKGLSEFRMADNALCWYLTTGAVDGDRLSFTDSNGKRRHRAIVGRSETRKVNWHVGFRAKAVVGHSTRFVLRPAVLFSHDGRNLVGDPAKMHRLRRSFCRNWWNDRWRDLMLAYVTWLSNGTDTISLWASDVAEISVSAHPLSFEAPVSCIDPSAKSRLASDDSQDAPDDLESVPDEWNDDDQQDNDEADEGSDDA